MDHHLAKFFDLSFHYKDDILSLNNHSWGNFKHHINPKELEINNITFTVKSASYLDLHWVINGKEKLLRKLYGRHNYFLFRIVHVSFICAIFFNIPSGPVYGAFISQIKLYIMPEFPADFLYRARLLIIRLLEQVYVATSLKSSVQKFYSRCILLYHENRFVQRIKVFFPLLNTFMSNSVGVSRKAEDVYPIDAPGPSSMFCSFTFVSLYILLWLFYILCCVCLFLFSVKYLSLDNILLVSASI